MYGSTSIIIVSSITIVFVILVIFMVHSMKKIMNQRKSLLKLKDELEKANEKLIKLDVSKNEFLSFATHQLRSPLTSVKWGLGAIAESLIEKHADAETNKIVSHLSGTTDDLISTVNDLLDISKIEQGGMVLNQEDFDLYDMTARIVDEFKMTAEAKGLKLILDGAIAPCVIKGDQTKLRQVLVNLIDNAVKYTQAGSVVVSFSKTGDRAKISVSDTGPGISPEELKLLFDKFIRGQAGKASQGGSGLGLYLAKKIVQLHNGTISAQSLGLGQGSVFSVELPIG